MSGFVLVMLLARVLPVTSFRFASLLASHLHPLSLPLSHMPSSHGSTTSSRATASSPSS